MSAHDVSVFRAWQDMSFAMLMLAETQLFLMGFGLSEDVVPTDARVTVEFKKLTRTAHPGPVGTLTAQFVVHVVSQGGGSRANVLFAKRTADGYGKPFFFLVEDGNAITSEEFFLSLKD